MKVLELTLILSFLFVSAISIESTDAWLKNYLSELKKTYDKRVAPVGTEGPGTPLKIVVSAYVLDINSVDDTDMKFNAQLYFRQGWKDARLNFTGREDPILLSTVNDIWTPDLFFIQERIGSFHQVLNPNVFLRINPDGEILYSVRISVSFGCPMDLRRFPHDIHNCEIKIESYSYTTRNILLEWKDEPRPVLVSEVLTMLDFDLIDYETSSDVVKLSSGDYSYLKINMIFQRKVGLFAIRIYVPSIQLVLVSILSLWIKAEERGLRLALLLVCLFFMNSLGNLANDSTPPGPYIKGIDVWIGTCAVTIFSIFLEFLVVAVITGKDDDEDYKSKGDILMNLESESKEQALDSDLKSPISKLVNLLDFRGRGSSRRFAAANRIDRVSRVVFPILFFIFNIIYWSVYCCSSI